MPEGPGRSKKEEANSEVEGRR